MKGMAGAIVAGLVAGAVGAAVWAGIMYYAEYELAIIAWGIGFLVGLAVYMGASDEGGGPVYGLVAAGITLMSILGARFVVSGIWAGEAREEIRATLMEAAQEIRADTAPPTVAMADELFELWKGTPRMAAFKWPGGAEPENTDELTEESEYPPELIVEARKRWEKMTPGAQAEWRERTASELEAGSDATVAAIGSVIRDEQFKSMFDLWDVIFCVLALGTAFRIGYQGHESA